MDNLTNRVAQYVRDKGISVVRIAERTGLPYGSIYPSLCANPTRSLRADEFMRICAFLDIDPEKFRAQKKKTCENEYSARDNP